MHNTPEQRPTLNKQNVHIHQPKIWTNFSNFISTVHVLHSYWILFCMNIFESSPSNYGVLYNMLGLFSCIDIDCNVLFWGEASHTANFVSEIYLFIFETCNLHCISILLPPPPSTPSHRQCHHTTASSSPAIISTGKCNETPLGHEKS